MRDRLTVDLACPRCGTFFTVALAVVLDGGTAWCPGCRLLTHGDPGAGEALDRLRRGHAQTMHRILGREDEGYGGAGGAERSDVGFAPN